MKLNVKKKKVYLALSGGVDSAVSALLLKKEGYEVIGCFMKNWSNNDFGIGDCPWEKDQKDAEAVCKKLKIDFRSFNFEKEYKDRVVNYFFNELKQGRTPNPDVMCNKDIKFGVFLDKALSLGADYIATGHYAIVRFNNSEYELLKGIDNSKDQSYFLCDLNQYQLSKVLFPIGKYLKSEIREIARENKLPVAEKPDSQGICFIGEINVKEFLRSNIAINKGSIIDIDNNKVVGEHDGVYFYTIGQREGLNIGGASEPYYVCKKNVSKNIVYVCKGKNNKYLFNNIVKFNNINWINNKDNIDYNNLKGVIRYRQKPESGKIFNNTFVFNNKQRAIAEGQKIAIYENDILRLSATIIN